MVFISFFNFNRSLARRRCTYNTYYVQVPIHLSKVIDVVVIVVAMAVVRTSGSDLVRKYGVRERNVRYYFRRSVFEARMAFFEPSVRLRSVGDHVVDDLVQADVVAVAARAVAAEPVLHPTGQLVVGGQIAGRLQLAQGFGPQTGHVVAGQGPRVDGPERGAGRRALGQRQRAQSTAPAAGLQAVQPVQLDALGPALGHVDGLFAPQRRRVVLVRDGADGLFQDDVGQRLGQRGHLGLEVQQVAVRDLRVRVQARLALDDRLQRLAEVARRQVRLRGRLHAPRQRLRLRRAAGALHARVDPSRVAGGQLYLAHQPEAGLAELALHDGRRDRRRRGRPGPGRPVGVRRAAVQTASGRPLRQRFSRARGQTSDVHRLPIDQDHGGGHD
ncbi:unnamed protein product [Aphis gossypii]|uniref:Uncharacterized protein n=1 Tax=Aphis gossypii TaxID=80765 RepID=A0A9P0NPI2_APHGO|nr:unnamed protein product [Aphis gossypii]